MVDQTAERSAGPRDAAGGSPTSSMLGSTRYRDTALSVADQWSSAASIIAIDIGVRGAIAFLTAKGELISVFDMPVLANGPAGRHAVNAPLLAEIVFGLHATRAFIEFVGARPGEGAVGAFAFGRSRGSLKEFWGPLASLCSPAPETT